MRMILVYFLSLAIALSPLRASQSFVAGSSQGLSLAAAPTNTVNVPCTISLWTNISSLIENMVVFNLQSTSDNGIYIILQTTSGTKRIKAVFTGAAFNAESVATPSTGVWVHICAVYTSSTVFSIFLNGTKATASVGSPSTEVNWTRGGIGNFWNGSVNNPWDGKIAEVAVWNAALTDADVAALYAGAPPKKVVSQALAEYWAFGGGVLRGDARGLTPTNQNSSTSAADHPRVYR